MQREEKTIVTEVDAKATEHPKGKVHTKKRKKRIKNNI